MLQGRNTLKIAIKEKEFENRALSTRIKVFYQKASLLYNSFILTNFNYCPLIWMFCGKTANEEVNRVHKRALRVLLNDFDSNFEELLHRNEEVTIHVKNLQKTYVRGIQMYYLWKPLLSVGVLQSKDASI